jgi:hypothetical protein
LVSQSLSANLFVIISTVRRIVFEPDQPTQEMIMRTVEFVPDHQRAEASEHVPEKLINFSDKNMLQLFDFERFLLDRPVLADRKTL